jgi:hypothetical protein
MGFLRKSTARHDLEVLSLEGHPKFNAAPLRQARFECVQTQPACPGMLFAQSRPTLDVRLWRAIRAISESVELS